MLYRYVYRSTGGDTALTEELTAAVFLAAARGFAAGDDDRMALGPLHDAARAAIARRARDTTEDTTPVPSESPRRRSPGARGGSARGRDVAALRRLTYRQRVVLALRYHDHLPVGDIAAVLATETDTAVHDVDEALDAFLAAAPGAGGAGGGSGARPALTTVTACEICSRRWTPARPTRTSPGVGARCVTRSGRRRGSRPARPRPGPAPSRPAHPLPVHRPRPPSPRVPPVPRQAAVRTSHGRPTRHDRSPSTRIRIPARRSRSEDCRARRPTPWSPSPRRGPRRTATIPPNP